MQSGSMDNQGIKFSVFPLKAAVDEKVQIVATGFAPREELTLRVSVHDSMARLWHTEAVYLADQSGEIDLETSAVANRLYPANDYMLLFSNLKLDQNSNSPGPPVFLSDVSEPLVHTFELAGQKGKRVTAELHRQFITEKVQHRKVRSNGLWGSFFAPETKESLPGVLVLGGAIGGSLWTERAASLLANHGFATLALNYFSTGDLPDSLVDIPLEYFSAALKWMAEQPEVNQKQLSILGKSKGAEAALLVAERVNNLKCVVCYSPSAVVYQGLYTHGPILSARSSWTYRGQSLPFVPCYQEGQPIKLETLKNLKSIHSANLDNSYIVNAAQIPVEKAGAPILVVAGEADDIWPSVRFGEMIMSRLARHQKIQGSMLLTYANAGHGIDVPFIPCAPFGGGTISANARASEDAWNKCIEFLKKHLVGAGW